MEPVLRDRDERRRYPALAVVLLVLAACAATFEQPTFHVLAGALALCATILVVLALSRGHGDR